MAAAIAVGAVGASPAAMLAAAVAAAPADSWTRRALVRVGTLAGDFGPDAAANLRRVSRELTVEWWPWADLVTEAVPLAFGAFLACGGEFRRAVWLRRAQVAPGKCIGFVGGMSIEQVAEQLVGLAL